MYGVTITELIEKLGLRNMTMELDTDAIVLVHPDVNRPALQLTGFFDHFDKDRVQIIGYVEQAYLDKLTPERRHEVYDALISSQIPCLLFSRGMKPEEDVLELCNHYFRSDGGSDPLAQCEACSDDQYSRCPGGRVWRGCPDYGRERDWKERGRSGTD